MLVCRISRQAVEFQKLLKLAEQYQLARLKCELLYLNIDKKTVELSEATDTYEKYCLYVKKKESELRKYAKNWRNKTYSSKK